MADDMERGTRLYSITRNGDSRLSTFLGWTGAVCCVLVTTAICWGANAIVEMKGNIAVLLSRPEGISKAEYDRDMNRMDLDISEIKRETRQRGH
jgi:hypothetical protein